MRLAKNYTPGEYEAEIYQQWEKSGAFSPDKGKGKPFSIIMPPPNANGRLHAGHASGYTIEDVIARWRRMQGYKTLWLPGTDHAGIETQFVYERDVLAPTGQDRFDLGQEKFYAEVLNFTVKNQKIMLDQMRAMGFSADWSKSKFTLEDDIVAIVYDTFKRLHADGHVYRGNRIVNWCPRCQAAFADIELERKEQKDELYTLNYGPLQVATVRPETIFGDVAVAVNPDDERYQALIGQNALVPLINRPIPIIADKHVDPNFGTGALKITPGHDPNDYTIGAAHKLAAITVIDLDGKLINVPEEFAGLNAKAGRAATVSALEKSGALATTENYSHAVAIHDRCSTQIEPLISEQWFLRIKALNRPVIEAIEQDEIEFHPKRFKKIALDWLKQEHDWCIGRQIWWGIKIPVYYKTNHAPDKSAYIVATTEQEAIDYFGAGNYRAETDTFDTWFSSGQWPFATLETTGDFAEFYPTSLMATAREILHKWVTRMIMFGIYRTGKIPFKDVYLWGLVTDLHGQKMSKSKGNVLDPLKLSEKYGTDALRLATTMANTPGNDSPLAEKQVESMRNFCNKLWNVARFILSDIEASYTPGKPVSRTLSDKFILSKLSQSTTEITRLMESYRFNEAANAVYHLLWDDFASWYLEGSKGTRNDDLLIYGLETILKLVHPFTPFLSEVLWQQMPWQTTALMSSSWPEAQKIDMTALGDFADLQAIITEIRNLTQALGLVRPTLYHAGEKLLADNAEMITKLAGLSGCANVSDGRGLPIPGTSMSAWLDADDDTVARYSQNLRQELEVSRAHIANLEAKLANKGYLKGAPKAVVAETKDKLTQTKKIIGNLSQQLARLEL